MEKEKKRGGVKIEREEEEGKEEEVEVNNKEDYITLYGCIYVHTCTVHEFIFTTIPKPRGIPPSACSGM